MIESTPAALALRALRAPDQRNMGRCSGGMGAEAIDRLASLDACAHSYRTWSPMVIPGVLQTSRYMYAAFRARTPSLATEEIVRRVRHRVDRTERFLARWNCRPGTFAWLVVGEQAITSPLLNIHAHGHQLMHLLNITRDYPNVFVQVLRDDVAACRNVEPFSIFALDEGPRVGYLESFIGGWYTTESEDCARLYSAFSDLIKAAYTPGDSRDYIREVLETCWGHTEEPSSSSPATPTPSTASMSLVLPPAPSE